MHCPLSCGCQMKLLDKEQHLLICPKKQQSICIDCQQLIPPSDLQKHRKTCKFRLTCCFDCGVSLRVNELARHNCKCRVCGASPNESKEQRNMADHHSKEVVLHIQQLVQRIEALESQVQSLRAQQGAASPSLSLSRVPSSSSLFQSVIQVTTPQRSSQHAERPRPLTPQTPSQQQFMRAVGSFTNSNESTKSSNHSPLPQNSAISSNISSNSPQMSSRRSSEGSASSGSTARSSLNYLKMAGPGLLGPSVPDTETISTTQEEGKYQRVLNSRKNSSVSSTSVLSERELADRFVQAITENLFRHSGCCTYTYTGPRQGNGHARFCEHLGGDQCLCQRTHDERYVQEQLLCKHGSNCDHLLSGKCYFVHLETDKEICKKSAVKECNRGYLCDNDSCPFNHHAEALKVWRVRKDLPKGFRLFRCKNHPNCKFAESGQCRFYHSNLEAFCSNCFRIGHPAELCKLPISRSSRKSEVT